MNIFSYDSSLSRVIMKIADFFILNVLIILCSIPLITIGTSLTAAHYVSIKRVRGSEESTVRLFFRSFKENFKQSTLIWLMIVVLAWLISVAQKVLTHNPNTMALLASGVLLFQIIVLVIVALWIFPIQSRFINKITTTIKFSFYMSIRNFGRTLLMAASFLIPVFVVEISMRLSVLVFMFGLSVPIYLNALIYNNAFRKQENMIIQREKEESGIVEEEQTLEEKEKAFQSMASAYGADDVEALESVLGDENTQNEECVLDDENIQEESILGDENTQEENVETDI